MPINLETGTVAGPIDAGASQVQTPAQIKIFSPKFFSSVLTGNGQNKRGLLSDIANPAVFPTGIPMTIDHTHTRKTKMTSGLTTTTMIPVNPLTYDAWGRMNTLKRPANALITKFGQDKPTLKRELFIEMRPHSAILEETDNSSQGGSKAKRFIPCYQVFIYFVADPTKEQHAKVDSYNNLNPVSQNNLYAYFFTTDPVTEIETAARSLAGRDFVVDFNALNAFIQGYSLYDHMVKRSEEWQTTLDLTLEEFFQNVIVNNIDKKTGKTNPLNTNDLRLVISVIRHIDQYSAPLDLYRSIYHKLAGYFHPSDTKTICRQNLNLLLSDTMENLNRNKPNLNAVRTPNPIPPKSKTKFAYSTEQSRAIASQEPLVLVQSGAGTGKQQPYSAKIATPSGWTTMGELKVGDLVIGSDGLPHKVLRIHEQGVKPGYRITFRDGSQTEAGPEHLWTVITKDTNRKTERRQVITTEKWLSDYHKDHSYLPVTQPVQYAFGEKNLPLDPYFLGALIADGNLCGNSIQYTKSERSVAEQTRLAAARDGYVMLDRTCKTSTAKQWGFAHPDDTAHNSRLKRIICELGLDVKSREKFIPEEYKTASIEQRKALLNGLFDGDGDIRTGRTYARFNTASDRMADDVLHLLWSLGLNATKQRQRHRRRDYWFVNLLDPGWDPFVASEYAGKHKGSVRPMRRGIKSVEKIDPVPMRCIEVDAPDRLYLTDDFIVTHNSTVILGRIDWMVANGVKPQDIMVLSFTNAAADHIKDLNPNVKSMTIAHMIHTIYSTNFPDHLLSELDTLVNSLDIYFPTDDLAMKFKHRCIGIINKEPNAYVDLNNFVEEHYDDVMRFLDTTRQTSLELEIIICYQKIDTMTEPPEIQSQHLIIDEVQDNSVFEFVYALKYVEKHRESLFIVGDCSQTLYEFRASNPRAMNVLEASGVFATHQLQVNYRSNQEILDFANVLLQDIEANQYAQIQLIANSMATVTEQSFREKVRLLYERVSKMGEINDILMPVLASPDVKAYMDGCLARGEKIAFLAYTKQHVRAMEDAIHIIYPGAATSNMIPVVKDPTTVLSRFIQTCWSNIQFVPTKHILQIIVTEMQNNLPKLSRNNNVNTQSASFQRFAALASKTIDDWRRECARDVNDWEIQYRAGQITQDELLERIKTSMLDHEIKNNKTIQSLKSGQNKKIKEQNAKSNASFIFSTIHSAKGLEFDNVILVYKDNSDMSEPDKRMYYVAMTRAMHSEFILAFNTLKNTRIKNDYDTIVAQLHQTHPMPTAAAVTGTITQPANGTAPASQAVNQMTTVAPASPVASHITQARPTTPPPPVASIASLFKKPDTAPAPDGTATSVGIHDLFPGVVPGAVVEITNPTGLDDIQLPPGLTFISADGKPCVIGKPDTGPDLPPEPKAPDEED